MNCLQPPPGLPEILSTDARDFEPGAVTPPGPYEIFAPSGPLTSFSEALLSFILGSLFDCPFYDRMSCAPF